MRPPEKPPEKRSKTDRGQSRPEQASTLKITPEMRKTVIETLKRVEFNTLFTYASEVSKISARTLATVVQHEKFDGRCAELILAEIGASIGKAKKLSEYKEFGKSNTKKIYETLFDWNRQNNERGLSQAEDTEQVKTMRETWVS